MKTKLAPVVALALGSLLCAAAPGWAGIPRADFATLWVQGEDALPQAGAQSAPPADADTAPADRTLRVQVWHDKGDEDIYERGEALRLYFRTDSDAYVVVYRIDADGVAEVLWPNTRYNDGFVYGGHTYTLPAQGSPERLRVSLSKGVEYVEAIASKYPFDLRNLAMDFAFDRDATERYDYKVAGDPFLAVNDINYAVTGLEEDVDYVVTDWAHLYVEERVEYARYSCNQCHTGDGHEVHPYVDRCTYVSVNYDWGWYDNWYGRYGWWPVYYDPLYWYWDFGACRSWYFPYYRVSYRWPGYGIYSRPFPLWSWCDSPHFGGDYWTLHERGRVRQRPLYASGAPASQDRFGAAGGTRERGGDPPSITRSRSGLSDRTERQRTAPVELARTTPPERSRGELLERSRTPSTPTGRDRGAREVLAREGGGGGGRVRTEIGRTDRVMRSLPSPGSADAGAGATPSRVAPQPRSGERAQSGARRWTQPVIRNTDPQPRARGGDAEPDRLVSPPPTQRRASDTDRGAPAQPRREAPARDDSRRRGSEVRSGDADRGTGSSPAPQPRSSRGDRSSSPRRTPSPAAPQVAPPPRSNPPSPSPQVAPPRPAPAQPAPARGGNEPRGGGRSGQASRGSARGDAHARSDGGGSRR